MIKSIMKIFMILIFLNYGFSVNAQIMFQKIYGDTNTNWSSSIIQLADSGYLIAGQTINFGAGWGHIALLRLDAYGDTLWTKTYDGTGVVFAMPTVIQTISGNLVIAATTDTFGAGDEDIYLIKTKPNGDTLWTKTYGGSKKEECNSIIETSDNGYLITGSTQSYGDTVFYKYNVYIIRTDINGDTLWTRTIGGTNDDKGVSAVQTSDGKFAVCGSTRNFWNGTSDIYLIILDTNGVVLSTKIYGNNTHNFSGNIILTDSGFVIAGSGSSNVGYNRDVYLIHTDFNGDTLWAKSYTRGGFDYTTNVKQTTDGGFVITGLSKRSPFFTEDVFLIKTDQNGDLSFVKTYGGNSYDVGNAIIPTFDDGFIIIGSTQSFALSEYFYLIKTDNKGNSHCNNEGSYNPVVNPTPITIDTGGTVSAGGIINPTSTIVGYTNFVKDVLCDTCALPVAGFYHIDSILTVSLKDTSQGATSHFWDFGDGNTSYLINPVHTYNSEGTYTVCLTVSNDCGTDSICKDINAYVSIRESLLTSTKFSIQPNPYINQTNISYHLNSSQFVVLDIYDLLGKKIKILVKETQQKGDYKYSFSTDKEDYPSGIYFVRLKLNNTIESLMAIEMK